MTRYRFSGWVNGTFRTVTFSYTGDLDTLYAGELYVMNNHTLYSSFYKGATDADYDASITSAMFERQGWVIIEGSTP